ncbi:hypothetical protein BCR42DRAFT_407910 [Absidia repens]|uniref:Uncharacterized protein n=1 Tax=Absidia repens TaxID=90262 RepID=A0A1X2IST8_9FUNG|nr:hypothetical protein BCR42DRAFT_407910 [Absidia repens]
MFYQKYTSLHWCLRSYFFFLTNFTMIDRREQQSDYRSKEFTQRSDQDDGDNKYHREHEQQSSNDMQPSHSAVPTRAQQERHRHNLRLNGQVDIEHGSVPRYAAKEKRRDSFIDRINNSTKEAIRRTSIIAAVDEKKLIDKVADSINDYGEHHQHDSWTDKVLGFLFPSMGLDTDSDKDNEIKAEGFKDIKSETVSASPFDGRPVPAMVPSDLSYDRVQQNISIEELMLWAIETADLMDSTDRYASNQHPKTSMKAETSDQDYDTLQAEYPDDRSIKCYGDALEKQLQMDDHLSMSPSWSVYNDLQQHAKAKKHNNRLHPRWPALDVVDQSPSTQSIESAKKDRRRQRQHLRKQKMDTFAA